MPKISKILLAISIICFSAVLFVSCTKTQSQFLHAYDQSVNVEYLDYVSSDSKLTIKQKELRVANVAAFRDFLSAFDAADSQIEVK